MLHKYSIYYKCKSQSSFLSQEVSEKRVTQKLEESSASQMIEDNDTAVLFEIPQKNTDKPIKSNDIRHYQTMSQIIDEDIKLETQKNSISEQTDLKDTKHCQSVSQMIENESMDEELCSKSELSSVCLKAEKESNMDLNECVGDVSFFSLYLSPPLCRSKTICEIYISAIYYRLRRWEYGR